MNFYIQGRGNATEMGLPWGCTGMGVTRGGLLVCLNGMGSYAGMERIGTTSGRDENHGLNSESRDGVG